MFEYELAKNPYKMLSSVKLNPASAHDGNFLVSVLPHFGPLVEFVNFVTVRTTDMHTTNFKFIFALKRGGFQSSDVVKALRLIYTRIRCLETN